MGKGAGYDLIQAALKSKIEVLNFFKTSLLRKCLDVVMLILPQKLKIK